MDSETRQSLIAARAEEISELGSWHKIKKRAVAVGYEDVLPGYDKWSDMSHVIAEAELVDEDVIEEIVIEPAPVEVEPEPEPEPELPAPAPVEVNPVAHAVGGSLPVEPDPVEPPKKKQHKWIEHQPQEPQDVRDWAEMNGIGYCSKCKRPHQQSMRGGPICPLNLEDCPRNGS